MKFFNTAGPCDPQYHYMLPATARLREENVMRLIETHSYFILHAPRQTGKTTAMMELARELSQSGRYTAALLTLELGAGLPNDVGAAERAILNNWRISIVHDLPPDLPPRPGPKSGNRLGGESGRVSHHPDLGLKRYTFSINRLPYQHAYRNLLKRRILNANRTTISVI